MNYTWRIHSLTKETRNSIDDVVIEVVWSKIGIEKETGIVTSVKRSTVFTEEHLNSDTFIPYNDLNRDIIVSWIEKVVNQESLNQHLQYELQKIKSKRTKVEEKDFPWTEEQ